MHRTHKGIVVDVPRILLDQYVALKFAYHVIRENRQLKKQHRAPVQPQHKDSLEHKEIRVVRARAVQGTEITQKGVAHSRAQQLPIVRLPSIQR